MASEEIVQAMIEAAIQSANSSPHVVNTPETRAAYARGVRAMAGIVSACNRLAEQYALKHKDDAFAGEMFKGYAKALQQIVKASDDLIPSGWEA